MDQSDAGRVGLFPRQTDRTQDAWVCSPARPMGRLRACMRAMAARSAAVSCPCAVAVLAASAAAFLA
eukprot:8439426-Pyramimonas_sp.AAC.1